MARSFSKDVEHAVNNVVEAMVKKLFEIQEKLMRKESDFLKLHQSLVNDLEKNIVKQFENQRFSVDGEKGTFEIKGLQHGKIVFSNEEKTLHIPLEKVDLVVKAIDFDKTKETLENEAASANSQPVEIPLKMEFDSKEQQLDHIYKELTPKEKDLFKQLNRAKVESLDNYFADRSTYKESNKYKELAELFSDESKSKVSTLFHTNIHTGTGNAPKGTIHMGELNTVENNLEKMKQSQIEKPENNLGKEKQVDKKDIQTVEISKKDELPDKGFINPADEGKNLIRAKEINQNLANKINSDVENNLANIKGPFLINSQVRGQMEVLNHLKSLSDKEIIKDLKEAEKQAKIENKSIAEIYSSNLQKNINGYIQASKERTLDTAINTYDTNKELRNELRNIELEINKNMGVLYQAKLEQKISIEEYNQLKERLDQQKNQFESRISKINQNEMLINEQLKTDLKYHFSDLKTDKLSLNESITIAKAAYSMTDEKTIDNLKNFSMENQLKETIQLIDKTTKEVEYEIKEITEIAFSR